MAVAGIMITVPVEKAGGSLEGTTEELRKSTRFNASGGREGGRVVGGGGRPRRSTLACLGHGRASQKSMVKAHSPCGGRSALVPQLFDKMPVCAINCNLSRGAFNLHPPPPPPPPQDQKRRYHHHHQQQQIGT